MTQEILVLKYSEKAHIIIGDTRAIKDEINRMGGRWNNYLTHPITKKKVKAWIISSKKYDRLVKFIEVRQDYKIVNEKSVVEADQQFFNNFDEMQIEDAYNRIS